MGVLFCVSESCSSECVQQSGLALLSFLREFCLRNHPGRPGLLTPYGKGLKGPEASSRSTPFPPPQLTRGRPSPEARCGPCPAVALTVVRRQQESYLGPLSDEGTYPTQTHLPSGT